MAGRGGGRRRWPRAAETDNNQPGHRTRHAARRAHLPITVESVYATVFAWMEATGICSTLVGAHRQLCGRLCHLLQRPCRRGDGSDARNDGQAEADGERRQDTSVSITARTV